jgi:hypothetical protein
LDLTVFFDDLILDMPVPHQPQLRTLKQLSSNTLAAIRLTG